jgi:hypothetical protein
MTGEDPREFGLSAADLRDAADRLYGPADTRLDPIEWTADTQAKYGRIRSRLRSLADAIDTGDPHEHRPGPAEQLAVLRVNRAVYHGASPGAAREAAGDQVCAECVLVVAVAWGINLAEQLAAELAGKLAPGAVLDAGPIRAAILDVIDRAEAELRSAGN